MKELSKEDQERIALADRLESFNLGFNEAIEEVKRLVNKMTISKVSGEIALSTRFFKEIQKLKK